MATPGPTLLSTGNWPEVLPPLAPEQQRRVEFTNLRHEVTRESSAERFSRRGFCKGYSWFCNREPIDLPHEILAELVSHFVIRRQRFRLLPCVPTVFRNLCIGVALEPRLAPIRRRVAHLL